MNIFNFKIRLWYVFLFNVTFYTPSLYTSGSMMQQKVKKNIIGPYRIKTMEKIYFFFFFTWIVIIYEVRNINIKKVKTYIDTTSKFYFFLIWNGFFTCTHQGKAVHTSTLAASVMYEFKGTKMEVGRRGQNNKMILPAWLLLFHLAETLRVF